MDKIQKINSRFYDRTAAQWAASKTHSFYSEAQFRKFITYLKKGTTVLDIGCAQGRDVPLFLGIGRNFKYEGLDISKKLLKIAKSRYPQLSFRYGNVVDKKTLPKKKYGAFWAAAILQHIPAKDWGTMLDNIASLMKKGAVGYFSIPDDRPNPASKEDPRHFTLLKESQVSALVRQRGWRILAKGTLPATRETTVWRWYIVALS